MVTSPEVNDNSLLPILEEIILKGSESFGPILERLMNMAMQLERSNFLKADRYERSNERIGYANGFKKKSLNSRTGKLRLQIPQVRDCNKEFYPSSLEKGSRSERALNLCIAEMYVKGVTTRRVKSILQHFGDLNISSTQVSNTAKILDEELERFRNRDLEEYPVVYLDARYEKVRHGGIVKNCAVLLAIGVNLEGHREILGVSIELSEAEVHWRNFLSSLVKRGLKGVKLIISDAHEGLKAARTAVFPSIPWQRCIFHMAQNAQHHVPKNSMRKEIGQVVREIFNAPNLEEAKRLLNIAVEKYSKSAPKFAEWIEENAEEGFTFYSFNKGLWRSIKTSNMVENLNRDIKRRTWVSRIFPSNESCLRLVTAIVQEKHEDWISSGRRFLNPELF